jgi:hypothetical protein
VVFEELGLTVDQILRCVLAWSVGRIGRLEGLAIGQVSPGLERVGDLLGSGKVPPLAIHPREGGSHKSVDGFKRLLLAHAVDHHHRGSDCGLRLTPNGFVLAELRRVPFRGGLWFVGQHIPLRNGS